MKNNRPLQRPKVCKTVEETVYSGNIHSIFKLLKMDVDPYIDTFIQKIWEKDIETIHNYEALIRDLLQQFQKIKEYVALKQIKEESLPEDIIILWEDIIPVIEANIEYILEQHCDSGFSKSITIPFENYDEEKISKVKDYISQLIKNNKLLSDCGVKIPIMNIIYMPQIDKIFQKIEDNSRLEAQAMISNIEDIDLRVHILIQIVLRLIDQHQISYALHLLEQIEGLSSYIDRDNRYVTIAVIANMKKTLLQI